MNPRAATLPNKLAVLLEDFSLQSPGQHLLDRLLAGYRDDGEIKGPSAQHIWAHLSGTSGMPLLQTRARDFTLKISADLQAALHEADAVLVVQGREGVAGFPPNLLSILPWVSAGARCFVYGPLEESREAVVRIMKAAAAQGITLASGSDLPTTYRLPDFELPRRMRLEEALIVVQGRFPVGEYDGLQGLLPLLEQRRGGEAGVVSVRSLDGSSVWKAGDEGLWSWDLLSSALSRSHTPQGHALLDGRTEDLVGLGEVRKLAAHPRARLMQHRDGLRSAILVLDGATEDVTFVLRTRDSGIVASQLFRPPAPQREHFSALVAAVNSYFATGKSLWPESRALLECDLLDRFRSGLK